MNPKLGVVAFGPIQYHTPLWQLLTKRGIVDLNVLFLSDAGVSPIADPSFGVQITWDIDLLSGYAYRFLTTAEHPVSIAQRVRALARWLPTHDAVVVNGYTSPWMLLAMTISRTRGIPYLLRASSHPEGPSTGSRRYLRSLGTRLVISGSAGGLSMGELNTKFYRQKQAGSVIFAPNSVDDERFACEPLISRSDLLARWGLRENRPVIIFSGKLIPRKRPLDLIAALNQLPLDVNVVFIGDGMLAERIRNSLRPGSGAVTGFINQSDIPSYYHSADILVLPSEAETWGLVVNEAMAAGVLPIVSDRVGCAPDLVRDIGEVFRCGDVTDLAEAISRAIARLRDPQTRNRVREHVERYSLERTAAGFEQAAWMAR